MNNKLPTPKKEVYLTNQYYGEMIHSRSILSMYRGSITHGTYIKDNLDDIDIMDIVVPPLDYYFGLKEFGSRGTVELKYKEWDIVAYECKKFISLLEKSNPNVIGMLWLRPEFYISLSDSSKYLLENRGEFSSKLIFKPFMGYAYSQFAKMQKIKTGAGYAGEKRKELITKFGYDTKNASHLIRLLRMAREFLDTGIMGVYREDAEELINIKLGSWSYEQVVKEKDRLIKELELSLISSKLPNCPNYENINHICTNVIDMALNQYK